MSAVAAIAGAFWLVTSLLHAWTILLVSAKLRRARRSPPARPDASLISLVRTVCGIENYVEESLRSGFLLSDPAYELIFCAHSEADPVVPLVRRLMTEYDAVPSRLLFGDAGISVNPKLNNIAKSLPEAKGEWIVFCDSNVILEPDHIRRLFSAWRPATGVASTIHIGTRPENFWAEIECAFLNPYHARWHLASAALGNSFAHGKIMLMRRGDLEEAGGMQALTSEIAEDVAITKLVRKCGKTVEATFAPVAQPLGERSAADVFNRQARWSRLRHRGIPLTFLPEILSSGLLSIAAAAILASHLDVSPFLAALAQAMFWYGAELLFLKAARWPVSWRSIPAFVIRDAAIPVLWIYAWLGREFRWNDKLVYWR